MDWNVSVRAEIGYDNTWDIAVRGLNKQIGKHMESEGVCLPHCELVDPREMFWNQLFIGIGVDAEMLLQVQVIGDHAQGLMH